MAVLVLLLAQWYPQENLRINVLRSVNGLCRRQSIECPDRKVLQTLTDCQCVKATGNGSPGRAIYTT